MWGATSALGKVNIGTTKYTNTCQNSAILYTTENSKIRLKLTINVQDHWLVLINALVSLSSTWTLLTH